MTTEQKLELFVQTAINNVKQQREQLLAEYEEQLKADFAKQKEEYRISANATFLRKQEKARLEINRRLSDDMNHQKSELANKTNQLTIEIFEDVIKELNSYRATTKYVTYLEQTIAKILALADGSPVSFSIDAKDSELLNLLTTKTGITPSISKRPLLGGVIAKLPDKNLLIDESFQTKLNEAKAQFIFNP